MSDSTQDDKMKEEKRLKRNARQAREEVEYVALRKARLTPKSDLNGLMAKSLQKMLMAERELHRFHQSHGKPRGGAAWPESESNAPEIQRQAASTTQD